MRPRYDSFFVCEGELGSVQSYLVVIKDLEALRNE